MIFAKISHALPSLNQLFNQKMLYKFDLLRAFHISNICCTLLLVFCIPPSRNNYLYPKITHTHTQKKSRSISPETMIHCFDITDNCRCIVNFCLLYIVQKSKKKLVAVCIAATTLTSYVNIFVTLDLHRLNSDHISLYIFCNCNCFTYTHFFF